jgi:hypothetical protein
MVNLLKALMCPGAKMAAGHPRNKPVPSTFNPLKKPEIALKPAHAARTSVF